MISEVVMAHTDRATPAGDLVVPGRAQVADGRVFRAAATVCVSVIALPSAVVLLQTLLGRLGIG
ncbi:hypothetical protein SUDANB176_06654 [Streptomyces sp. enrichment culture]|uniref:hypothetical protein n=1 Tax=Streptomyces sp. enrichment culture TaxID=1795815 RepID=UPI003F550939